MNPENYYLTYARARQKANNFRTLSTGTHNPLSLKAPELKADFSTNDYLGLACDPALINAAYQTGIRYGAGATGSRLLSGNHEIFMKLETQIARDKNTEAALIFNCGYQANISALAALLNKKNLGQQPLVYFDRANHNSLYQGVKLSGAQLLRYRHRDMTHLQQHLQDTAADKRPKFIVSETMYGMEGNIASLEKLKELAQEFDAFLYLDEAHATGLFGPRGYGLSTTLDLSDIPHLIMGTFSKALGCCGAYVACSEITKDYLVNQCGGFIYSTALSPMVIGAVAAAWDKVASLGATRAALFNNAELLRKSLNQKFNTGSSMAFIVPVILGEGTEVLKAREILAAQGIRVSAILPPTVPAGSARLRIAITARHTSEDIDLLAEGLSGL